MLSLMNNNVHLQEVIHISWEQQCREISQQIQKILS